MPNSHWAIVADAASTSVKPKMPATIAIQEDKSPFQHGAVPRFATNKRRGREFHTAMAA